MESNCIVIGIGGATCGGKTTVAKELQNILPGSVIIHQDDFYYPIGSSNLEYIDEIGHYNWDSLSALNMDKLISEVESVIHTNETRIIIIEGNMIFNITVVAKLCTKKYFLTVSKEIARYRRITRKYKRYDQKYFDEYAWPLHESHKKAAFDVYKDIIVLDGDLETSINLNRILNNLQPSL